MLRLSTTDLHTGGACRDSCRAAWIHKPSDVEYLKCFKIYCGYVVEYVDVFPPFLEAACWSGYVPHPGRVPPIRFISPVAGVTHVAFSVG